MMNQSIRKYVSILFLMLSIVLVVEPFHASASAFSQSDPAADARRFAADESGTTWFLIGCVGGLIGYIIATAITPNPPASALVGKDEEYVATFTDTYASEVQQKRKRNALTGCLVGTGVSVLAYAILVSSYDDLE